MRLRPAARPRPRPRTDDRYGQLEDGFGNLWTVATHKEDVPPEEMRRRAIEAMR